MDDTFLEESHTKTFLKTYEQYLKLNNGEDISTKIKNRLQKQGKRFFANDNISEFITEQEKQLLIQEATVKAHSFLNALVIDIEQDPNSEDTAYRLAKMYFNEIMSGRYEKAPSTTSFPNDGSDKNIPYKGMLIVPVEIKSLCSHHHQPVWGKAYIGVILEQKAVGLSKYMRIAQHCSRRGTLQEQLCSDIAHEVSKVAETSHIAVYLECEHGCVKFRGVEAGCSSTSTTVLLGNFLKHDVRDEFFQTINLKINQSK
jgi:GTP cyclohydrolase I